MAGERYREALIWTSAAPTSIIQGRRRAAVDRRLVHPRAALHRNSRPRRQRLERQRPTRRLALGRALLQDTLARQAGDRSGPRRLQRPSGETGTSRSRGRSAAHRSRRGNVRRRDRGIERAARSGQRRAGALSRDRSEPRGARRGEGTASPAGSERTGVEARQACASAHPRARRHRRVLASPGRSSRIGRRERKRHEPAASRNEASIGVVMRGHVATDRQPEGASARHGIRVAIASSPTSRPIHCSNAGDIMRFA